MQASALLSFLLLLASISYAHPADQDGIQKRIHEHNERARAGKESYFMDANQTVEEDPSPMSADLRAVLVQQMLREVRFSPHQRALVHGPIPEEVDWRKKGVVTRVKQQGRCGSCWAFAAIGALESHNAIAKGKLVELSEQHLVDCSWGHGNFGCSGGYPGRAFLYIIANGGISTAAAYPYAFASTRKICRANRQHIGATAKSVMRVPYGNEEALKRVVATVGPVAVAISAGDLGFRYYRRGVYFNPSCGSSIFEINHAVVVVGYGKDPQHGDYWIVKNSHGPAWGDGGYIRMARNRGNACGIATLATYPVV